MTNDVKAPEEEKSPDSKGKSGGDQLAGIGIVSWIIMLVIGAILFTVSHYATIFLILGMTPAIIARITDKRIGNSASRTIGAFNFMGIVPYLFELYNSTDKALMAKHIATDTKTWVFVYSAAAMGWVAVWIIPQIISIIFSVRAQIRIHRLETSQKKLVDEWGEEVTDGTTDYVIAEDDNSFMDKQVT